MTDATVKSIVRYPVKSLLGESLQSSTVGPHGLGGDRRYALQDVEDGAIAAAKNPRKWAKLLTMKASYLEEPSEFDDVPPPVLITLPDGTRIRSDQNPDEPLSRFLGRKVRLLNYLPSDAKYEFIRTEFAQAEGKYEGRESRNAETIDMSKHKRKTFVDIHPIHLLTTASLRQLSELYKGEPIDVMRYRPNILVDYPGTEFVEQEWDGKTVCVGDLEASVAMPTPRCIMTTLNHGRLPIDRGQFRTINRHNTLELEKYGRMGCLGIYVAPLASTHVSVGDAVTVKELAENNMA